MRIAAEVNEAVNAQEVVAVFVDEAGVGGGVVDRLKELGAPVIGVQAGGRARLKERFEDLRAEIFWELRRRMAEEEIALPDDPELVGQLLSLRYRIESGGRIRLVSKEELRKAGLPSPDKADALALAFMSPPSMEVWM